MALVAVLAAGCGGTSKTGSASGAPAGTSVAPASAIGFVSLNTDASSTQWKNADALLSKFPIRDKLLADIEKSTHLSTDILPLLGPEVDLVVLAGSAPRYIGMTQPTEVLKFDALLERQSPPLKHEVLGGWTIFGETQASLDAFKSEAANGKLADADSFKRATADLPTEANAIAYVNGAAAMTALKSALPAQAGAVPTGKLEWIGAALSSQPDLVKLVGSYKSGQSAGQTFKPALLSHVPSGALLVASFRGGDQLKQQLTQTPGVRKQIGQVEQFLGVTVDQIAALVAGEGVLYVSAGVPYPEVTLVLRQSDPSAAATTLNKLVTRLASFANAKVTDAAIPGESAKKVALGGVSIYFGVSGDNLVISDSAKGFGAPGSTSITDDPVFQKASEAAGRPDQSAGFLYVNIKDSVPLIQGLAELSGTTIPPDVITNLAPLQSFLAYATADNGVGKFAAVLQAR